MTLFFPSLYLAKITNNTQNVAQHTTFTIPSLTEAYTAEKAIKENNSKPFPKESLVAEYLASSSSDPNLALAKMRMEIENQARLLLGKRREVRGRVDIKFLGLGSLWRELLKLYPEKDYLSRAFKYVSDVCNAAVHGQIIPQENVEEALSMGIKILDEMKNFQKK